MDCCCKAKVTITSGSQDPAKRNWKCEGEKGED
jgi:hypothetical protein